MLSARACICAFASLSEVWNLHTKHSLPVTVPDLVAEAERYIYDIAQEETTDGLQATLIHLRNLFWTAYVLDKELSIRTGQPPAIRDEDCDLTLPPGYEEQMYTLLSSSDAKNTTIEGPLFPSDLRLLKIKSRVYNTFYQPGSLGKSQTEILISIRELDNDLEKWRLSLPPNHRPTLLISQQLSTDSPIVDMHLVIVRMDYHHCMSIIHQASGRCKATGNNSNTPEGVRSSFALAVETSRSSLLSLQGSLHLLPNGTFCIVLEPLSAYARQDLELLCLAVSLIKKLPRQVRTQNFHVTRLQGLITELTGLAELAITKAEHQQDSPFFMARRLDI
ncbi:unnamed protein product [Penicillium crustosum]